MGQSAFITLADGSAIETITLDEIRSHLLYYREQAALTGQQLGWDYAESAFPYTIESKPEGEGLWFYLKGKTLAYRYILFGIGTELEEGTDVLKSHIQVVLPDDATHGDKAKANELCKFLAKRLSARLTLFNERIMYFNSRK
ncbi:hypothetical protein SY83_15320 [Paenibacillus swuensis]|uniref:DUF1885 family protein n=1 Tax=Paenibacillus swuensis TaxID=1178515 RepID=A0A172TKC3_9BACL|nr:DUF1885 family protein [Paenibacillus swuensis]ANE47416.1 hypothetical protein SY83_15320 [Paenibacillus swuensis]